MLKNIPVIFLLAITVLSCNKKGVTAIESICEHPIQVPPLGYSIGTPFVTISYDKDQCGYFPLSKKNYWVYLDSDYNGSTGQFLNTSIDTLRFIETRQTPDGIIWWQPNLYGPVLDNMYSTDTLFYTLGNNSNGIPVVKWFYPIYSDSAITGSNYSDYTGIDKAYKIPTDVIVPAGSFSDCLLYQKIITFPTNLDMVFKPGVGVLKFKQYFYATSNLYKISTLLSYHLE